MFNLIGVGEHAGSGVPDIFDVWESEGLETPMVEEQFGAGVPDRTTPEQGDDPFWSIWILLWQINLDKSENLCYN